MAEYVPAKINTAYIFYASLVSQANTKIMQVNPTIAAGDFKVSIDGGALANLATLPAVTPAGSTMVKFSLSSGEMNGDNITIVCLDAAGAEWCDVTFSIQTAVRQIADLATPTNITAGTITTVTNLINAPTAGDLTATMKTSVTTAVPTAIGIADAAFARSLGNEAVSADGAVPTLAQALFEILSSLGEFSISGTTITCKKRDGSTSLFTSTLDSSTAPTSRTRAT